VQNPTERLDALTGLRFVAAATVFVSHLKVWLHLDLWNPGTLGSAAVGFFFVLSGFILAHVYRRDGEPIAIGRFYLARFARIWPVHLVCLALMLPSTSQELATDASRFAMRLAAHLLLLQAWTTDPSWAQTFNGPAWSLSVEVFFYALFPLLARCSTRTLAVLWVLCWACNLCYYAYADSLAATDPALHAGLTFFATSSPIPRLQEFLLGICAHALWRSRAQRRMESGSSTLRATALELAACAAVVASFRTWSSTDLGPAWIQLPGHVTATTSMAHGKGLSIAFAALVYLCACGRGLPSRLLASAPMRYLGEISYSFYLVHAFAMHVTTQHMGIPSLSWREHSLYSAGIAIAAAAIAHATVELPMRHAILAKAASWRDRAAVWRRTTKQALRAPSLLACCVVGASAFAAFGLGTPTLVDRAHNVASHGAATLRDIRFGKGRTLLGAMTGSEYQRFQAWVALREEPGATCRATLEARSREGAVVHEFAIQSTQATEADGTTWTLLHAEADFVQLLGSHTLTLTITGRDGQSIAPDTGPVCADGKRLELLRLPW
jgi:peptidoglycan/LPS O-acetylase OafA/YrhL